MANRPDKFRDWQQQDALARSGIEHISQPMRRILARLELTKRQETGSSSLTRR